MGAPYVTSPPREWEDFFYEAIFCGRYGGKSFMGAARHLLYVTAHPGSTNIIAVPNFKTANRGTLPALKKVLRSYGFQQGAHWDFNKTDMVITYHFAGDATAIIVSLDDEDSGRSIRAGSIWLDEAGFVSWEAFKGLQPTMTEVGLPHQMWLTSTPTGKGHWTYPFFFPREAQEEGYSDLNLASYIVSESGGPLEDRKDVWLLNPDAPDDPPSHRTCMFAETKDNPYGGAQEAHQMALFLGVNSAQYKQEQGGRFVVQEDATYPQWNTDHHAKKRSEWPEGCRDPLWKPDLVGMGVDFGKAHKSAIVVTGIDHYGRWFMLECWSKTGSNPVEVAENAARLATKWGATACWSDHDPGWRYALVDALGELEIPCLLANKQYGRASDPSGGLGTVARILAKTVTINGKEEQACFVDRELCWDFVREIENYHLPPEVSGKPQSEHPQKINDDCVDAGRYNWVGMVRWRWDDPGFEADQGFKVISTTLNGSR
jgi:hypothetical protein